MKRIQKELERDKERASEAVSRVVLKWQNGFWCIRLIFIAFSWRLSRSISRCALIWHNAAILYGYAILCSFSLGVFHLCLFCRCIVNLYPFKYRWMHHCKSKKTNKNQKGNFVSECTSKRPKNNSHNMKSLNKRHKFRKSFHNSSKSHTKTTKWCKIQNEILL